MSFEESKPDCVHCRFMLRTAAGEYRCKQHDLVLHSPISLFCRHLTPPEAAESPLKEWIHDGIDRSSLQSGWLYTWIALADNGDEVTYIPFVRILEYVAWSPGMFWRELRHIRQQSQQE